jgi:hypothetical protein
MGKSSLKADFREQEASSKKVVVAVVAPCALASTKNMTDKTKNNKSFMELDCCSMQAEKFPFDAASSSCNAHLSVAHQPI